MRQFDTGMQNMWTANKFLPKCWNRKLDYHFLHINIFSSGWRRVPPLARWLGTSTPSSWGSSRTARTLSRTLRLSTLMKWAITKIQFRLFKSTSNPNCLGDVRSLPRRRQRLWRTSCRWEVLRSWEGGTRLHFEQISILIIIAMQKLNLFGSRVYPYTSSQNGRLVATPMWLEELLGDTDSLRLIKRYFAWFVVTLKSAQRQHKYENRPEIQMPYIQYFSANKG